MAIPGFCTSARRLATSLLCLFLAARLEAQEYRFQFHGVEQGLTNLAVKVLYQDRRGTLWVGAQVVAKFDPDSGTFAQFNLPARGHIVPTAETITALHDDANGFLWLGITEPILFRFDQRTKGRRARID